MRGKVSERWFPAVSGGITPAYAGKRQGSYFKVAVIEDHPRLCGEKLGQCTHFVFAVRITPAYAGKRLYDADDISNY